MTEDQKKTRKQPAYYVVPASFVCKSKTEIAKYIQDNGLKPGETIIRGWQVATKVEQKISLNY